MFGFPSQCVQNSNMYFCARVGVFCLFVWEGGGEGDCIEDDSAFLYTLHVLQPFFHNGNSVGICSKNSSQLSFGEHVWLGYVLKTFPFVQASW